MRRERCAVSRLQPSGGTPGARPRGDTVRFNGRLLDGLLHFTRPQRREGRAVSAALGRGQKNVKTKMVFDLTTQPLKRLAKNLFPFAAAQADQVGVLLLHAGLVVVLVPAV